MVAPALFVAFAIVFFGAIEMLIGSIAQTQVGQAARAQVAEGLMMQEQTRVLGQMRATVASLSAPPDGNTAWGVQPGSGRTCVTCADRYVDVVAISPVATDPNSAIRSGPAVAQTQNVETDVTTGNAMAPRFAVALRVTVTAPGGVTQTRSETFVVRAYNADPYADIIARDEANSNAGANLAADISGCRPGVAGCSQQAADDRSVHGYDVCADPSNSGACQKSVNGPIDRSIVGPPVTSVGPGVSRPW